MFLTVLLLSLWCLESYSLRLVGGASRCSGTVGVDHRGEWRRVEFYRRWDQEDTAAVCRELDCGSAVYGEQRDGFPRGPVWKVPRDCVKKSSVRRCIDGSYSSTWGVEVMCSDSVRLVSGSGLCSGLVQILDGSWTGVCDGDLDQRGAEVLCRELGCGAPLLQGALSPLGQMFHCEGNESALMDCPRSGSTTCSSGGAAVNLTCSELRLVGGASRCSGMVEVEHRGEWRRVEPDVRWGQEDTAAVCRALDCGSAVYGKERYGFPQGPVWRVPRDCVKKSSLRGCVSGSFASSLWGVDVVCSDLLNRPIISVSVSDGISRARPQGVQVQLGSKFRVKCSVESQYLEGSFRLLSPAAPPAQNRTLPAVNHSAHFLFSDADHGHKGNYTCVYLFNHNFSSQSTTLQLSVGDLLNRPIISVSVSDGVSRAHPQGLQVQLGSKFIVKCSVEPQYPGGSFQLLSPATPSAQNRTLPAVNHSAHFLFFDADHAHKGNYTCVYLFNHNFSSQSATLQLSVGDLLNRPIISVSVSDGISRARPQGVQVQLGSKFRVKCSVESQYLDGSFRLLSPTAPPRQNRTLPAVNRSAHFLFFDADHAHKGNYTCVYLFNHNFSSQSTTLQLSVGELDSDLIIRAMVILLLKLLYILPMYYCYCKVGARGGARERPQRRVRSVQI